MRKKKALSKFNIDYALARRGVFFKMWLLFIHRKTSANQPQPFRVSKTILVEIQEEAIIKTISRGRI